MRTISIKKHFFLIVFGLLFSPQLALGSEEFGLGITALYLFPLIIFIKVLYFKFYSKLLLAINITFPKIFGTIFFAHFLTFIVMLFFEPFFHPSISTIYKGGYVVYIVFTIIPCAWLEWGVYLFQFRNTKLSKFDLLRISIVVNTISLTLAASCVYRF